MTKTKEEIVHEIIHWLDEGALTSSGTHPSDYIIENGKVYRATIDYGDRPSLGIDTIDEFIEYWLPEMEHEMEQRNEEEAAEAAPKST